MIEAQRTVRVDADPSISQTFRPWLTPRLVPLGTVADVTRKRDNIGRNDGGGGQKKRT